MLIWGLGKFNYLWFENEELCNSIAFSLDIGSMPTMSNVCLNV